MEKSNQRSNSAPSRGGKRGGRGGQGGGRGGKEGIRTSFGGNKKRTDKSLRKKGAPKWKTTMTEIETLEKRI